MLKKLKGFTILQLILSVALLAIIVAIVYVAINPGKHFMESRNEQRVSDLISLRNGLQQYTVNNQGAKYPGLDENLRIIGTDSSGCTTECRIVAVEGDPAQNSIFQTQTNAEFNAGTYTNTFYNPATTMLELNNAGKTANTGSYTSKIFDSLTTSSWENLDWAPLDEYNLSLPDNKQTVDAGAAGTINMSGNQLLLHLDQAGSSQTDSSGSGNNATAYSTSFVTGQFDGALNFNGSTSYINIPNSASLNPTNQITLEAWIKWTIDPTTGAQWSQIINKNVDDQYQLQHNYNNTAFEFAVRTNVHRRYMLSTTTPLQGVWYHVVGTYDGSSQKIYVNGNLERTQSTSGTLVSSVSPVNLGRRSSGDRRFTGDIDEVAIYDRALTASEISSRYNAGKANLKIQIRACEEVTCADANFIGPDGTNSSYYEAKDFNSLSFDTNNIGRYFQYKLILETGNTSFSPRVGEINISSNNLDISSIEAIDSCIDFQSLVNDAELVRVPFDPSTGNQAKTNYGIRLVDGVTQLYACTSEDNKLIMNSFR